MKNKRGKKLQIIFSNRWLYTFILIGLLILVAVGVSALTAGVKPNPGHTINETAPPAGCTAGQYLQWNGADWVCIRESCSYVCDADYQTSTSQIARFSSQTCAPNQKIASYLAQSDNPTQNSEYADDVIIDDFITPVNPGNRQALIIDVRDIEAPYSHKRLICVLCCSGVVD